MFCCFSFGDGGKKFKFCSDVIQNELLANMHILKAKMQIVIIGTGNTATVLGRKLKAAGHQIVQVIGRDGRLASELAKILDAESTNIWSAVNRDADIYLLAVSDIAVEEVFGKLELLEKTIVHTAASVSKNLLQAADHYGVFYPLQSLRKETADLPEVPIVIDASDEATFQLLEKLAYSISNKVIAATDEERMKLHLAAVFCNNFVNHLYVLMESYCLKEHLDFSLLIPLISETASRIEHAPPSQWQTGPAWRDDSDTIKKHLALLNSDPELMHLYETITASIRKRTIAV
jgi:predicted short-subunit dehydrogenase-like oxidoreductase (DUF2520 family)